MSRIPATCIAKGGVRPLGGTVDGVDQMAHHGNPGAEVPCGKTVTVVVQRTVRFTSHDGDFEDAEIPAVRLARWPGWYLRTAFKFSKG